MIKRIICIFAPSRQRSYAFRRLLLHCWQLVVARRRRLYLFESTQNRVQSLRSLSHYSELLQKGIVKLRIEPQLSEEPLQSFFAASHDLQLCEYKSVERFAAGGCLCHVACVSASPGMVKAISIPLLCCIAGIGRSNESTSKDVHGEPQRTGRNFLFAATPAAATLTNAKRIAVVLRRHVGLPHPARVTRWLTVSQFERNSTATRPIPTDSCRSNYQPERALTTESSSIGRGEVTRD